MKYKILSLIVVLCLPVLSQAQNTYTLRGSIAEDGSFKRAYLTYRLLDDKRPYFDSCDVRDGKFEFSYNLAYTVPATIAMAHLDREERILSVDRLSFYLDPSDIFVVSTGLLSDSRIENSPTSTLSKEYSKLESEFKEEGARLQQTYERAGPVQREVRQFKDSLDNWHADIQRRYNEMSLRFISEHPDNILGVYMLLSEIKIRPSNDDVEPVFNSLSDSIRNTPPGKYLASVINENRTLPIGADAPEVQSVDSVGRIIKLSDFRGKYVLLNFWSPDCNHCLREIKNLKKVYEMYGKKDFEILNVAIEYEDKRDKWLEVVVEAKMSWTNVSDLNGWQSLIAKHFKTYAVPYNYLIDPRGIIIAKELYGEELAMKLKHIFNR